MNWRGCFFFFFLFSFCGFGRRSIAKVFSHNCSFGCVRLGCIPECQEALFRDRGMKSCRDILRRSVSPRGPPRRSCESSSVCGSSCSIKNLTNPQLELQRERQFVLTSFFFLTPEVVKHTLKCPRVRTGCTCTNILSLLCCCSLTH